jgi:hypothetical protein
MAAPVRLLALKISKAQSMRFCIANACEGVERSRDKPLQSRMRRTLDTV